MLAEGSVVSAVTDFGVTAEAGDARLDPLTAPVYLSAPEITRQPLLLAATLFAHEPAAFGEHGSAGLYDHGGPLAASMSTISPG
jgi:hypothetical protein